MPIGIPFDRFVELATSAKKVIKTKQKVILGVDRLDYTKGLVNRLKAFEILLERHPEHRGNVSFLQISVPSRTDVLEYQQLKEEMDQLVGEFIKFVNIFKYSNEFKQAALTVDFRLQFGRPSATFLDVWVKVNWQHIIEMLPWLSSHPCVME